MLHLARALLYDQEDKAGRNEADGKDGPQGVNNGSTELKYSILQLLKFSRWKRMVEGSYTMDSWIL